MCTKIVADDTATENEEYRLNLHRLNRRWRLYNSVKVQQPIGVETRVASILVWISLLMDAREVTFRTLYQLYPKTARAINGLFQRRVRRRKDLREDLQKQLGVPSNRPVPKAVDRKFESPPHLRIISSSSLNHLLIS
ncbi:hypothetical protein PUN28_014527 [Cardiocondyla obscurior]|uniref:Uncharacterized protein n=1 Tax=Cardiocondyla obscurior TaxID=286306 RepID=A0AAW2F0K0_9HYME